MKSAQLKIEHFSLSINLNYIFRGVSAAFCFSADMCGGKTPCKRKTAD